LFGTTAVYAQKRGPSTPEERQKAIQMIEVMETDPFSKNAEDYRGPVFAFLESVPDITIKICPSVLGDMKKLKGDSGSILVGQLIYSQAKFIIQNPDKADDYDAFQLAGLEGVLRTYQSMKKSKPKTKFETLDSLEQLRVSGQLANHIATSTASCKQKS
jgi:hypothetical protein